MTLEEAIAELKFFKGHTFYNTEEAIDMAIQALEQEPKTGHWIDGHCSECDCEEPTFIVEIFGWKWIKDMDAKYCPNCGAKMESEVRT